MLLGIDSREAMRESPTGKGFWTRNVITELQRRKAGILPFCIREQEAPDAKLSQAFSGGVLWHWRVSRELRRNRPVHVYLSPTSFIVPAFVGKAVPTAIVIHDLIALADDSHAWKARMTERVLLQRALSSARWIFTVSESTRSELLRHFPSLDPKRITVVYAGPSFPDALQAGDVPRISRTILSIGTLCPRKNQLRLIEAFRSLPPNIRENHRLILAGGRGWNDAEIIALAASTPGVEWRGYVPMAELSALLHTTTVLAFPSITEGFGLPILDAFVAGTPVLTSDASSMREVAGNAAVLVDPKDPDDIACGLKALLTDPPLRSELVQRGYERARDFTWEKTVDRILGAMGDTAM